MIIFDNGHGGIINGVYQTKGKRSPEWSLGEQLFEGVFNRNIVNKLTKLCKSLNIECITLVPEPEDISLRKRVNRANKIYKEHENSILLSIHANAGGGTGFEMFTSVGETKSDRIANILIKEYSDTIPQLKLRKDESDGDLDKEAKFTIITETYCPAILIETAFMDKYWPDCKMLLHDEDIFVEAIFNGILQLRHLRYI